MCITTKQHMFFGHGATTCTYSSFCIVAPFSCFVVISFWGSRMWLGWHYGFRGFG